MSVAWDSTPTSPYSPNAQFWIFSPPTNLTELTIAIVEKVVEALPIWNKLWQAVKLTYKMNNPPSPVIFNGMVYCFYAGPADTNYIYYSSFNGQSWSDVQAIPGGAGESTSPSATVYNNQIYVFYQGFTTNDKQNGVINYSTYNGTNWSNADEAPNSTMSESPSAAAFNNALYVFYQGAGGNGQLWYAVMYGTGDWDAGIQVSNVAMTASPSAVTFTNPSNNQTGLYVFHQGGNSNGELWYNVMDAEENFAGDVQIASGANIGGGDGIIMSAAPNAAVYDGALYVLFEGPGNDGQLWYVTSTNGSTWSEPCQVAAVGLTGSPSLAVWGTQLICAMQGPGNSGQLWFASLNQGGTCGFMTKVNNEIMSQSPYLLMFTGNNQIYCFLQGQGNSGALYYTGLNSTDTAAEWWPSYQVLPEGSMSNSPAAVGYNGTIYVFYQGTGKNQGSGNNANTLNYSASNENWKIQKVPEVSMSQSPSPVAWNGQIYVFYIGESYGIWWNGYNTTEGWAALGEVPNLLSVDTSASPSAVVFNNQLYLFYIGPGYSICYIQHNSSAWNNSIQLSNATQGQGTESFQAVVYDNGSGEQLYVFFQGHGLLYYMSTSDPSSADNWSAVTQVGTQGSAASPSAIADLANLTVAGTLMAPSVGV